MLDISSILESYHRFQSVLPLVRSILGRPLTYTEKILYTHLMGDLPLSPYRRGEDYANFKPDRVAMQDATAQMALLQFMQAGRPAVAIPTTVHCDHLIMAQSGASTDLSRALSDNLEVYAFLESVSRRHGIGFWKPGSGIIHQVVLEQYAFPGGLMIGTDSHTPNAGGLGMLAIGVGGSDAVDAMAGLPWELKVPKIIGVRLSGRLSGWASPKDVILKLAGLLTVSGGTDHVVEYFGEGVQHISCTGKGTICNMGAEIGATSSLFPYDDKMRMYLQATGRSEVIDALGDWHAELGPDSGVLLSPSDYYDQLIDINLDTLEPHINGPFTPDKAWPISEFKQAVDANQYPSTVSVGLIGSCTNSSYEDMARAASIAHQAVENGLTSKALFTVTPGSEQVRATADKAGILSVFDRMGAVVLANACGPCIGQWKRHDEAGGAPNSIVTSFNRNFSKRNDGQAHTHAFVASPEVVTALAIAGDLRFNPLTDPLPGTTTRLSPPIGDELPPTGFVLDLTGFNPPSEDGSDVQVLVSPDSERLQLLAPFPAWEGTNLSGLSILIKAEGKCTTDHISQAGVWLRYRGHLDRISNNLLIGALNAFNQQANHVWNRMVGAYMPVPDSARLYQQSGVGTVVIGEYNYGEGSSREHAAMEPRHLGVRAVIVKSFARIHESNLKKQGILALCFEHASDYDLIREYDVVDLLGVTELAPQSVIIMRLRHDDGTTDEVKLTHTYNDGQVEWFKAGAALNVICK